MVAPPTVTPATAPAVTAIRVALEAVRSSAPAFWAASDSAPCRPSAPPRGIATAPCAPLISCAARHTSASAEPASDGAAPAAAASKASAALSASVSKRVASQALALMTVSRSNSARCTGFSAAAASAALASSHHSGLSVRASAYSSRRNGS